MRRFFPYGNVAAMSILWLAACVVGCSSTTGWRIPGTEKGAGATTTVYLVLENVDTMPEQSRSRGEIYVDGAFFGHTSRPFYNRFVGNKLVVGEVQIEREREHTVAVRFPGYEPFEQTRYFGTLPEYSISFRLKQIAQAEPVPLSPEEEAEETEEGHWYQFWRWFGE